jgi:hypothetical protein
MNIHKAVGAQTNCTSSHHLHSNDICFVDSLLEYELSALFVPEKFTHCCRSNVLSMLYKYNLESSEWFPEGTRSSGRTYEPVVFEMLLYIHGTLYKL